MLATPVLTQKKPFNGPRPINLNKDLEQVLGLLDLAFGQAVGAHGRRMFLSQATLGAQAPVLARFLGQGRNHIPGFVWEEAGRVIGNVTLVESEWPGRYLIANVAVHPDHRRLGIARALMQETLGYIEQRKGRQVLLQVESENNYAIHLYRSMAFKVVGGIKRWETSTSRLRMLPQDNPGVMEVRPLGRREWHAAYELDRATLHPDLNWPTPPSPDHFKRGWWRVLTELMDGRRVESWAIKTGSLPAQRRLVGMLTIYNDWGRPHELKLRVHPEWRGDLEPPLITKAVLRLKEMRHGTIRLDHPADDEVATSLLKTANFANRRNLTVMKLDLN